MKRVLAGIAAAAMAFLTLGGAGTANAQEAQAHDAEQVPFGAYISELATRGTGPAASLQEFVEISARGFNPVEIGGYSVVATFGNTTIRLAEIPEGTTLEPRETYLLASTRYTGPGVPDQLFETQRDLPDRIGVALVSGTAQEQMIDSMATTSANPFVRGAPAPALTAQQALSGLSLHRVAFTGNNRKDFARAPRTPGVAGTPAFGVLATR